MYQVPDGMTVQEYGSHPIRTTIRYAAHYGPRALPSDADLDALGLDAGTRAKVAAAAAEVADIHATGDRQPGWELAEQRAYEILADLPPDARQPPAAPDPTDGLDPDELAQLAAWHTGGPSAPDRPASYQADDLDPDTLASRVSRW